MNEPLDPRASKEVDLVDLLAIPYRNWKAVVFVATAVLAVATFLVLTRTDKYEVSTLIEIGRAKTQVETWRSNAWQGQFLESSAKITWEDQFVESASTLSAKLINGFIPAAASPIAVEVIVPDRSQGLVQLRSFVPKGETENAAALQRGLLQKTVADHSEITESTKRKQALKLSEMDYHIKETEQEIAANRAQAAREARKEELRKLDYSLVSLNNRLKAQQEAVSLTKSWYSLKSETKPVFGPAIATAHPAGFPKSGLLFACALLSVFAGVVASFLFEGFVEMRARLGRVPRLAHSEA